MKKVTTVLLSITLVIALFLVGCSNPEHEKAVTAFEDATVAVEEQNAELSSAIDSLQAVISSGDLPFDETTLQDAETAVTTAKASLVEVPEMPESTEDINAATDDLMAVDYSSELSNLLEKQTALEISITQLKQVSNPSEAFVVERIEGIETITGVSAATEDNDPNNQLNKQGGYTAAVFFSSSLVNQDDISGASIIEKGTDGGGCIEVFATTEDAEARSSYLAAFDGTVLSSGSHQIVGTVLVRTSSKLTATQQTELTEQIVARLAEVR